MIKFVVAALWIAAAAIGAVWFSFDRVQAKPAAAAQEKQAATMLGGLDYIRTDIISVPELKGGKVAGYFLTRLVYTVDPVEVKKLVVPAESLLMDQVYTYLYANPQLDLSQTKQLNLDALRNGIKDAVNTRLGQPLLHEILIEQVDYISKEEIRQNTLQVKMEQAPPKPKKGGGGHGDAAPAEKSGGH